MIMSTRGIEIKGALLVHAELVQSYAYKLRKCIKDQQCI